MQNKIDERQLCMQEWLTSLFPAKSLLVLPLAGDASFRRYFRATIDSQNFIVMDAPPEKENCKSFIEIARAFERASVRFPTIISEEICDGFLLLTDFGDRSLLMALNTDSVDSLYQSAFDALLHMQKHKMVLPNFNDALYWREFEIFDTWYVKKNLNKTLSHHDEQQLKKCYQLLIDSAHNQPPVFVHRDYHSRNIMVCDDGQLGILDFQDAVLGPITYDLVSLLRDCYVAWPVVQTEQWVHDFYQQTKLSVGFETFLRWFDLMGLQRHLKCLGIFSRLYFRDGKMSYLKEIPRVLSYVMHVCDRYPEFAPLKSILMHQPSETGSRT